MKPGNLAALLLPLVAVVLIACGNADSTETQAASVVTPVVTQPTPDPAEAEAAYFQEVNALKAQADQEVGSRFGEAIDMLFPDWAPSFAGEPDMIDAYRGELNRLRGGITSDIARFEAITPPAALQPDHLAYIKHLRNVESLSREFEQALNNGDFIGLRMARAGYLEALKTSRLAMSPRFCREITDEASLKAVCYSDDSLPGGEYGQQLRAVFIAWEARFNPWASVLIRPQDMQDDERLDAFARFHSRLTAVHEEAVAAVRGLEPPPGFETGHQMVIELYEGLASIARGVDQGVANRDSAAIEKEFAQSGDLARKFFSNVPDDTRRIMTLPGAPAP